MKRIWFVAKAIGFPVQLVVHNGADQAFVPILGAIVPRTLTQEKSEYTFQVDCVFDDQTGEALDKFDEQAAAGRLGADEWERIQRLALRTSFLLPPFSDPRMQASAG